MRHFFKSTYGQLTLMFGVLLLINFIVIILSLRELTFKPAGKQFAELINTQIDSVKPLLRQKSFKQAQIIISTTFPQQQISIAQNIQAEKLPALEFYHSLSQQLKVHQTTPLQLRLQESTVDAKIWIKFPQLHDYWLGISFQPFMQNISRLFVFIFVLLLILSLLAAFLFSRYMLKPFKQLAHMAADIVENNAIQDIQLSGTTETREIAQLVKASAQKIQQLNQEKEMLLAGVSHDLRTPLARMRLQAEFLNDQESQDAMVQDIEEMDAIIGDFVAYVRSGSFEELQKLSITDIIQETIEQSALLGKSIDFKPPEHDIQLMVKPLCLKRMLTNIYDNAYKYGKAPVQVKIAQNDNGVAINIIDHGDGLDEKDIKSIFDPFVMAQSTDNQYGSGLGLSIVKKMAQQNNATVSAFKHSEGGLCVCIKFKPKP